MLTYCYHVWDACRRLASFLKQYLNDYHTKKIYINKRTLTINNNTCLKILIATVPRSNTVHHALYQSIVPVKLPRH